MRLVLVDLDNTLVDRAGAFRAWANELVRLRRLPRHAVERLVEADRDGQVPRDAVFDVLRLELGVSESPDELRAGYRRDFLSKFSLAGEVREALTRLRQTSTKVVVVTNGPASQRDKVAFTGLDALVDGCIVSDDVGARKPDVRMFETAAALVGVPLGPSHWMVGDHPSADIGGACAAGLRSAWIRRGRTWDEARFAPTHAVDTFAEAVDLILAGP